MEIGSVPFLGQEDFSHLLSWFQDVDMESIFNVSNATKKRRRSDGNEEGEVGDYDGDELKKNTFNDILASLVMVGEEEKSEQEKRVMEFREDNALLEQANYRQQNQALDECCTQVKSHQAAGNEFDRLRSKRTHRATVAVADNVRSENSVKNKCSGSGSGTVNHHRRLWVKDRSKAWWDMCNHPDFPEEEFKRSFRMSKATFDMICEELDSVVTKKNTMLREAIPVRQRIAVCIWRLATGEPLRLVSKRFGLGISTCHKLVLEVCSGIKTVLMPKFIQWPNENRMKTIKDEFEAMSGMPNVGGSMYTTHIAIIAPKTSVSAYFNKKHTVRNQKTSYSVTVQGVVDPKGVFTDVCIGWPGSYPDDQVLEKSALLQRANAGLLNGLWVVGNSGVPLMDWLLVPYTNKNLTWTQHAFNEKIGDIQKVSKEAFARLKGRWTCLQKRTEVKLQDLPVVLGACCVLHNICEMKKEEMGPELKFELFDDETISTNGLCSASAMQSRDHIAHNLLHHGLAGTSFL